VASVLWSLALLIQVMKRLLSKASKSFRFPSTPQCDSPPSPPTHLSNPTAPHTTGLQPKFLVPAVPQPYPHTHLAILVSKDGLLIHPHAGIEQTEWLPCIRVSWGKSVKVEEIESHQLPEKLDWNEAVIVYGIVGILELFSCSFLIFFSF
jgi:phosphatidylinositol 4-phosphatase